jgi:cytoskeletal protein CcmA (bactofilin family)
MLKTQRIILAGSMASMLALVGCQSGVSPIGATLGLGAQSSNSYGLLGAADAACAAERFTVFAHASNDDVDISGSQNKIIGSLHTNDVLKVRGNNDYIKGTAEASHGFNVKGAVADKQVPNAPTVADFPVAIDVEQIPVDHFFQGDVTLTGELRGVYRATGKITVQKARGEVTLIADAIQFAGNGSNLTAEYGHLLAVATGSGNNALHLAGSQNLLCGAIAATKGQFQMTGHQNEIHGLVEAEHVKIAGSQNLIQGAQLGLCPTPAPTPVAATPSPSPTPDATPSPDTGASGVPGDPTATNAPAPTPAVTATPIPTVTATPPVNPTFDVKWIDHSDNRMSFQAFGQDGFTDGHFQVTFHVPAGTLINSVELKDVSTDPSLDWNTFSNANWLVGVYDANNNQVNNGFTADLKRPVADGETLNVYVADYNNPVFLTPGTTAKFYVKLSTATDTLTTATQVSN